jgi:hypothetical protein
MPYDPTNEHEDTVVLVTDPEATPAIEEERERLAFWRPYDPTSAEYVLAFWRSDTDSLYMVVEVKDGKAFADSTHHRCFKVLGKARAAALNCGLWNRRYAEADGDEGTTSTVEIRKHTYSKHTPYVQKTGDTGPMGCWSEIVLSIELVETIVC